MTYVLTLIGNTEPEPLLPVHTDLVCSQLELNCKLDWLAEDEACDLIFPSELSAAEITRQALIALEGTNIDAACIPVRGRRKHILISDMDSTIIDQECIDELGAAIGVGSQISRITKAVVSGEMDFPRALRQRMALMKGMEYSLLERVYKERITVKAGARTLVRTMRHHGAYCILVSGGFSFFTSRIAKITGFHDHQANELTFVADKLTGEIAEPILGRSAKLDTLSRLCEIKGLSPTDVLAVGDGANDIEMIRAAGIGAAFHGSVALKNQANICINHADLTALLYIQGYRKSEFDLT
ncbi:MAG: phosphoserine phosphatase SerB [Alphaproteobacteria bacterium]|nr:phosphoserine phosphatase SerB [Alphaproteobacteria bacterium]